MSKMHRYKLMHKKSSDDSSQNIKKEVNENEPKVMVKKTKRRSKSKPPGPEQKTLGRRLKKPHACHFCRKRFLHLKTLQVHRRSREGVRPSLECRYCLLAVTGLQALDTHEQTHEGPRPYLCTICAKGVLQLGDLCTTGTVFV